MAAQTISRTYSASGSLCRQHGNHEIIKLPVGLKHIEANEAVNINKAVQAREITYGD